MNRFVYECFFGLIEDGYIIDHINNIHSDNRLENLQKITQPENCKKDYKDRSRKAIKIRAINVATGEVFIYRSRYGAAKDLHLHSASIFNVLKGLQKTALSKKLNQRFTLQKIEHDTEKLPLIIINNKKISTSNMLER